MNKLSTIGLVFKPAKIKKPKVRKPIVPVIKQYCVCIETEHNNFMACVNIKGDNNQGISDTMIIPFTKESYDLKDKCKVFTIDADKKGRHNILYRSRETAHSFPGLNTIYTPFRNKYVYVGCVIKENDSYYFNVIDIVEHIHFCNHLVEDIKLPIQ